MNTRKTGFLCGAWLLAACPLFAQTPAAKLLDEVIRAPGHWDQMCSMPAPIAEDVPLPLYSLGTRRVHTLSQTNIARLQAQRAEVVAEINRRLEKVDLATAKVDRAGSGGLLQSGEDPYALTPLMLEVVLELNAVETVPGLLRIEADLNQRMEKAEKDKSAPLPELFLDGSTTWQGASHNSPDYARERAVFTVRIYQRQLLSVTAALLRHERFKPVLDSEMEKRYFELLKRNAQSPELSAIKKAEDIPADQRGWIVFDPIHELAVRATMKDGSMPYTPELRAQIRQFAADYQKQSASALSQNVKAR